MTYIAYLDEFGHIGPYISKNSPKYNDSPVFGLAGFISPITEVRNFGTWFYQQKCLLLDFEIKRSGAHPSCWEKKGSKLYTVRNIKKYRQIRNFTNRFLMDEHDQRKSLLKTSSISMYNQTTPDEPLLNRRSKRRVTAIRHFRPQTGLQD